MRKMTILRQSSVIPHRSPPRAYARLMSAAPLGALSVEERASLERQRNLAVVGTLLGGSFSFVGLILFARGDFKLGYTLGLSGVIIGSIVTALRTWSEYDTRIAEEQAAQAVAS